MFGTICAQNTFKISYKPVSKDCAKAYLTIFYYFDTLATVIEYDVMKEKNGDSFEKELPVRTDNLIAIGVNFHEITAEIKEEKAGKKVLFLNRKVALKKAYRKAKILWYAFCFYRQL
jgi:hypothetical protein